jgi:hypothetical protein
VTKLLFKPISLIAGLLAGMVSRKAFRALWVRLDDHEPPRPEHRRTRWPKLLVALMLEGAIVRAFDGAFERASREVFCRATGAWPGPDRPEPA